MASLDEDEKVPEKFYYKSKDSDVVYEAPIEAAKLSGLFTVMIDQQREANETKDNAIVLDVVYHHHEDSNQQFAINTTRMLSYVDKYFKIWSDKPDDANYVKETSIQTSDISSILKSADLALINEYLNDNILLLQEGKRPDYPDFSIEKFQNDENYKRDIKLRLLNELLCQVAEDRFLDIESFANKIYAYIATIAWEISLFHIKDLDGHYSVVGDVVGASVPDEQ